MPAEMPGLVGRKKKAEGQLHPSNIINLPPFAPFRNRAETAAAARVGSKL